MAALGTMLLKISILIFFQAVDFSEGELNNSLEIVDNNNETSQINTTEVTEIEIRDINKSFNKYKQRKSNQLKNVNCRNSDANSFFRETRSTFDDPLLLQFEKNCIFPGHQPCTCYYPDHINVTIFELGTDESTRNASGVNGTGPGNCQDLQQLGYHLPGFYMVRFNSKRIKSIFCNFNKTAVIDSLGKRQKIVWKQVVGTAFSLQRLRFCGAFKSHRCKYFYSDHPDSPILDRNNTKPTSCDDLGLIGHTLKGFYLVYLNAVKVQIVYCDFNKTAKEYQSRLQIPLEILNQNYSNLSKVTPLCDGFGSGSCSCYYSNFRDILQFELGNDEITQNAAKSNSTGPASCQDLMSIGYSLRGFYMVRFRTRVVRTIFCDFDHKMKEITSQVTQLNPTTSTHQTKLSQSFSTAKPPSPIHQRKIWSENISKPSSRSNFNFKATTSSTTDSETNLAAVSQLMMPKHFHGGEGRTLKNEHGKCLSPTLYLGNPATNGGKLNQITCRTLKSHLFWIWTENHVCSRYFKCISVSKNNFKQGFRSSDVYQLSRIGNDTSQKWTVIPLSKDFSKFQLMIYEKCLGFGKDSDDENLEAKAVPCNQREKGQIWSFGEKFVKFG